MNIIQASQESFMMTMIARLDAQEAMLEEIRTSQNYFSKHMGRAHSMLDWIERCMPPPPGGQTDSSSY